MYELLCRSAERPWAGQLEKLDCLPTTSTIRPLVLHMQENRSQLSRGARASFSMLGLLFMVTSIGPAVHGYWLVPAFSILALAALTFALERHGTSAPAYETLEFVDGRVRHRDSSGRQVELPAFWLRLAAESCSPSDLRLILRGRDGAIEFGRCLSLDERHAVVPLIASALAQSRGD